MEYMAYTSLVIVLLSSFAIVKSQDEVMCYNARNCGGDHEMSMMEGCCDNGVVPSGLSYRNSTTMECIDCPRAFGFFEPTYSGKERREAHSVFVGTISGPTPSSLNVTVTLNRITAGDGDMTLSTTNLTFSAGRDPLPVSFIFINDLISQEVNETFTLILTLDGDIEGYELHLILNGTILDDDIAIFKLSEKEYRVDEKANAMMPVKITKQQNVRLANPVTFRISPLTIDHAKNKSLNVPVERCDLDSPVQANSEDFNTTSFTVDFQADEGLNMLTSVEAFIAVEDDDINENGEQLFIVLLEVVNATDISLVDNTESDFTICKIIDNDPLVIGFEQPEYSFNEPHRIKLVQVSLGKDRESEQTFRVAITILTVDSELAASFTNDFKASNLTILFPPTSESIQYTFSLLPDYIVEGHKEFIAMSSPSKGSITYRTPDQTSGFFQSTNIHIEDNDYGDVEVGFVKTLYSVNESAVYLEVCIRVMKNSVPFTPGFFLELLVMIMPGSTASDMDDYRGFHPLFRVIYRRSIYNRRKQCSSILIIDDGALENVESIDISLSVYEKQRVGSVIISPNVTKIEILDDDDAVIGFINAPYTVNEFDRMVTMTIGVLNGSSIQIDVAISISLLNGSAIDSSDYLNDLSNDGMIVLNASNPTVNVSFSLVDDSIVEMLENLSASLSFLGTAPPRVSLDPASAEVIILGDDDPVIGFLNAPYIVNEYDRKVTVTVAIRTDGTPVAFLWISLISGTANVSSDYLNDLTRDGKIILVSRFPILNVSFSLVDDIANESQEYLSANIEILRPTDSHVILAPASADIIILGDEIPTVGFKKREYFVDECNCRVTMEVGFVSDGEVFPISLHISLLSGTANLFSDYLNDLSDDGLVVLNASNPTVNISFSVVDDSVIELLETLSVNLNFSSDDAHPHVALDPASALIYIKDNDEVAYGFEETKYSVNESEGILEVCCSVTNFQGDVKIAVSINAEISFQTRTGSADDNDFKNPPFTTFNLNLDEDINSQRFCFNITIINDEISEDNESFGLEISAPPHSGVIAWPNVTVISILDDDVLMKDDGDELYILNADQPSVNVSFSLVNDNIYEITKLVVAYLSFIGGHPADVAIANDSAQIYILDDEVLDFRFDPDMYTVSEFDVNVSLNVHLFSGNLGDIGVILKASIANSSNFHEFIFEGNDTLKSVELPIISNDMAGRPMDFEVQLSFINYTNGKAYKIHDKERIHLGGDAQVTICPPLPIPIIVGATLGSVALLILGAIIYLLYTLACLVRRRRKFSADQALEHDNRRSSFHKDSDGPAELRSYRVESSFKLKISKCLMINSCNLKMNESVGQGQYGIVYRGSLSKGFTKGFTQVVAVKTLKGFLDKSLVRGLLEECSRMSTFDHPNVLTLIGVCMDGGPVPYIVMPFMFNGSLISYLAKVRNELFFPINSEVDEIIMQATCKLMDITLQIAKGMEYLASKMIIHRDLAARNCMVDLHFVVKVSDFGLSKSIQPSKDYFRQQEKGVKLPFKWMAPESLGDGIFSEKTDVWSYGVTCWEVFSAGKRPYAGINATDLCPMLENGYRMDKPNNAVCSDIIYSEVIQKCWELKQEKRPNFSNLVVLISSLLEVNAGYTNFSEFFIQEQTTTTVDAETVEITADHCGDNTIQVMETTAIDKDAGYDC